MSSKPVDSAAHARWPRSLTARLTLLYTLTTFVTLFLAVCVLYWGLLSNLERDDNQFLADKAQLLRQLLIAPDRNADALYEEVNLEGGIGSHKRYYVRILDANGNVFKMTPRMLAIPASAMPTPTPSDAVANTAERWCAADTRCYLLLSAWAASKPLDYRLELVLDTSTEETLLANYRWTLLLVLCAGTFFAALVGIIVTRRGLRPLREVIRAVRNTSALQLNQRIGPAGWPAELANLGMAFDAMLERLEAGFNRISQFSTDLAHELRTPVNNLMGELEVALSRPRSTEEYRQALESSLEECARLTGMIDRLLFLARTDGATSPIERVKLDGRAETEAVCEYFEAMAEERGIALEREGDAVVHADAILLRRAVGNLVSNALQYTPAEGRVRLTLAQEADGGARICVTDTGIGIPAAERDHVFDRFYRSEAARRLYHQGTGLGLAIVRSIMALHGGRVTLDRGVDGGTRATLVFPPLG